MVDLIPYQNKCFVIRNWDDLFTKCRDNINSLNSMSSSAYYKIFEEDTILWIDKLNRVYRIFDTWRDVQRIWVSLESVFVSNSDIPQMLPSESSRFAAINKEFLNLMRKVKDVRLILDITGIPGLETVLVKEKDQLERIHRALGDYLDRERQTYPRFHFLGDDDLLELLSHAKDPIEAERFLKHMFPGIERLIIQDCRIIGVSSKGGETVRLDNPIDYDKLEGRTDWLKAIEEELPRTLSTILLLCYSTFKTIQDASLTDVRLVQYIKDFPCQILILVSQIAFTTDIESHFREQASLAAITNAYAKFLSLLSTILISETDVVFRRKCEHLIAENFYQKRVLERIISRQSFSLDDIAWLSTFRYKLNSVSDSSPSVIIEIGQGKFNYGFEYLGLQDPLIQTPLTDRCYLTLCEALHQNLGGSPFGPAGTGKTESVKALAHKLGRFAVVFNCDDSFDYKAVANILRGVCQLGAWACFDEFNRLDEHILSAVSQIVQEIQIGLKTTQSKSIMSINIGGKSSQLQSSTGEFSCFVSSIC